MMRALLVAIALALPLAAQADTPRVYATLVDAPAPPPSPIALPTSAAVPVHLWIDAGNDASALGAACENGAGDEICGFAVRIDATGAFTLSDFSGVGAVVANRESQRLRVSRIDAATGTLGPVKIGTLTVSALGEGSLAVASGEIATAALASATIPSGTIAATVPEPGALASQLAAFAALAWRKVRARS